MRKFSFSMLLAMTVVVSTGVWAQAQILCEKGEFPTGARHHRLGWSVAVGPAPAGVTGSGTQTVAIGSHLADDGNGNQTGRVEIYSAIDGDNTTWVLEQTLIGPVGSWFGHSVAVTQEAVYVGAPMDDAGGLVDSGSVFVYPLQSPE